MGAGPGGREPLAAEARAAPVAADPRAGATGQPGGGYPWSWAIYRWIDGQPYADELIADERQAARALGGGDGAWDRARGIALHQAVMLIPYYRETNPGMAALGRRTVGQVLADLRAPGGAAAGPGPSARSR